MTNSTQEPDKCGFMILTPTPLHNGGAWCSEKYPCTHHGEWRDKAIESVITTSQTMPEEWEKRFDEKFLPEQDRVPYYVEFNDAKEFIRKERALAKSQERARIIEKISYLTRYQRSIYRVDHSDGEALQDMLLEKQVLESLQKEGD